MKIKQAQFLKGVVNLSTLPKNGFPEIAFVGRSNVGKSSLINLLLQRKKLARTSNTPGRTREINYYEVNENFYLVDLPGYGYAKVPKHIRIAWEKRMIEFVLSREELNMLCHVVDVRHGPTKQDFELHEILREGAAPRCIVLSKADKLSSSKAAQSKKSTIKAFAERGIEIPVFLTSQEKGTGRRELWAWFQSLNIIPR